MFSLICARINGWVDNGDAGDLRRHRAHYDINVMNQTDGFDAAMLELTYKWGIENQVYAHVMPVH